MNPIAPPKSSKDFDPISFQEIAPHPEARP